MAKLWGGRFSKNTNELVDAFNASINYDKRLYREDIRGSIAHATMLAKQGIISVEDKRQILLNRALSELKSFEQKYASLTELCSVFDAIHALEESE